MKPEAVFIEEVYAELGRARAKFPQREGVWVTLAALTEEVGELNQAVMQYNREPAKGVTTADIRKEASQVVVMAIRVLFDCNVKPTRRRPQIDTYSEG